jgi:hypothetical protein
MKLTKDLLIEMIKKEISEYSKQRRRAQQGRPVIETAQLLIVAGETFDLDRQMVNVGEDEVMKLYIVKGGQKLELDVHGQLGKIMRFATNSEGEKVDLIPASPNSLTDFDFESLVHLK